MQASPAVLIDTDVFSCLYVTSRASDRERIHSWREALAGRAVVISFQTRAEVLAGIIVSGWGETRSTQAHQQLDRTPTVGVDEDVVRQYATLTAECRRAGHALGAKHHAADRWVAASAIAKDLPLLSGDGVYAAAPGLRLHLPS